MSEITPNRNQLIAELSALIRCESVNTFGETSPIGAESAMADLFEVQLRSLGLEIGTHEVTTGRRNV